MKPFKSMRLLAEKHMENFSQMCSSLYRDEQLADVTLYCKDGSVKAHKLILAASSPYFKKIFMENNGGHSVFIMHGMSFSQLLSLMELIYKGSIDVPEETFNLVCDLAEELDVTNITFEEIALPHAEQNISDSTLYEERKHSVKIGKEEQPITHNRDTRFKGQKRVTVNFEQDDDQKKENIDSTGKKADHLLSLGLVSQMDHSKENSPEPRMPVKVVAELNKGNVVEKLSSWAKKQRKFQCVLCPSSFKRASHLSRHQLVHTGERPFACDQCDKAFSRHDKLKHHVRKAHGIPDLLNSSFLEDNPLFTISDIRAVTPEEPVVCRNEPSETTIQQRRKRGRPRKHPPVAVSSLTTLKRPRGRPRLNSSANSSSESYDITNLPYGDIEYLTIPVISNESNGSDEMQIENSQIMEPFVEIKTEVDVDAEDGNKTEPESNQPEDNSETSNSTVKKEKELLNNG